MKKILTFITAIAILFIIAACSSTKIKVTFDFNGGKFQDKETLTQQFDSNQKISFPTPTKEGHVLDGWTLDDQKINVAEQIAISETTFKAQWKVDKPISVETFSLTLPSEVSVVQPQNLDLSKVVKDTQVTLKVTIPTDKQVDKLLVNNAEKQLSNNQLVLTITSNTTVSVTFKDKPISVETFSLTLPSEVSVVQPQNLDLSKVLKDTQVTLKVTIPTDKQVDKLLVNNVEKQLSNNQLVLTVASNTTVTVTFKDKPATVETFSLTLPSEVSVVQPQNLDLSKVAKDTQVTLKVTLPTGKQVDKLLVNNAEKQLSNNQLVLSITANTTVTVTFKDKPAETVDTFTLQLPLDGSIVIVSPAELNPNKIQKNTVVKFKVNAADNQTINYVKSNNVAVTLDQENSFEINFTENVVLATEIVDKILTITLPTGITVADDVDVNNIAYEEEVQFTIEIPEGHKLQTLLVNGVDKLSLVNNNVFLLTVTENITSIEFTTVEVKVAITIIGATFVEVSGLDLSNLSLGQKVELTINVAEGSGLYSILDSSATENANKANILDYNKFEFTATENATLNLRVFPLIQITLPSDNSVSITSKNYNNKVFAGVVDFKITVPEGHKLSKIEIVDEKAKRVDLTADVEDLAVSYRAVVRKTYEVVATFVELHSLTLPTEITAVDKTAEQLQAIDPTESVRLNIAVPTGMKIATLTANGNDILQTLQDDTSNLYVVVKVTENTVIAVTFAQGATYKVIIPQQFTQLETSYDLNAVAENTIIKFSVAVAEGKVVEKIVSNNTKDITSQYDASTKILTIRINIDTTLDVTYKDGLVYETIREKLYVVGSLSDLENVVVEKTYNGKEVYGIYDNAFFKSSTIKKVEIAEGIQFIGTAAFANTPNLVSVTLPNSITKISNYAFHRSNLTSITIPNSIQEIGYKAFADTKLNAITFTNTSFTNFNIESFYSDDTINALLKSNNEIIINNVLLHVKNQATYEIPQNVTHIAAYAFSRAKSLTKVTGGDNVTYIGKHAFGGLNGLATIPAFSMITYLGESAFENTIIVEFTIPQKLEVIEFRSFANTNIATINIPQTVKKIEREAFIGSENLLNIKIASDVKIGIKAFENTAEYNRQISENGMFILNNVLFDAKLINASTVIPQNVTKIETGAFWKTNVTTLTIPGTVETINEKVFTNNKNISKIVIDSKVKNIANKAFEVNVFMQEGNKIQFVINDIDVLDKPQTWGVDFIKSAIPQRYYEILWSPIVNVTFDYNGGNADIEPITIAKNSKLPAITQQPEKEGHTFIQWELNGQAFDFNTKLIRSITLVAKYEQKPTDYVLRVEKDHVEIVKYLGKDSNVDIIESYGGRNITVIDDFAFAAIPTLTSVTLPQHLTTIGKEAFRDTPITKITLNAKLETIKDRAFKTSTLVTVVDNTTALTNVGVDVFETSAYLEAQRNANSETILNNILVDAQTFNGTTLNSKIKVISFEAFKNNNKLTTLTIPNTVTTIKENAFENTTLTTVTISESVTNIEQNAFVANAGQTINISVDRYFAPKGFDKNAFNNNSGTINVSYKAGTVYSITVASGVITPVDNNVVLETILANEVVVLQVQVEENYKIKTLTVNNVDVLNTLNSENNQFSVTVDKALTINVEYKPLDSLTAQVQAELDKVLSNIPVLNNTRDVLASIKDSAQLLVDNSVVDVRAYYKQSKLYVELTSKVLNTLKLEKEITPKSIAYIAPNHLSVASGDYTQTGTIGHEKAEYLVDGKVNKKWTNTSTGPKFVIVTMDNQYTLYGFKLIFASDGQGEPMDFNSKAYNIYISDDKVQWTKIVAEENNRAGTREYLVSTIQAKYVKMEVIKGEQYGETVRLHELYIYSDSTTQTHNVEYKFDGATALYNGGNIENYMLSKVEDKANAYQIYSVSKKLGHFFKQWNHNGTKFDFTTPITSDIVLEAVFEPNLDEALRLIPYNLKTNVRSNMSDASTDVKREILKYLDASIYTVNVSKDSEENSYTVELSVTGNASETRAKHVYIEPYYTLKLSSDFKLLTSNVNLDKLTPNQVIKLEVIVPEKHLLTKVMFGGKVVVYDENKTLEIKITENDMQLNAVIEEEKLYYNLVLPSEVTSNISDNTKARLNQEVTLTVTPPSGQMLDKLLVNDKRIRFEGNTVDITIEKDTVVTATFKTFVNVARLVLPEGVTAEYTDGSEIDLWEVVVGKEVKLSIKLVPYKVIDQLKENENLIVSQKESDVLATALFTFNARSEVTVTLKKDTDRINKELQDAKTIIEAQMPLLIFDVAQMGTSASEFLASNFEHNKDLVLAKVSEEDGVFTATLTSVADGETNIQFTVTTKETSKINDEVDIDATRGYPNTIDTSTPKSLFRNYGSWYSWQVGSWDYGQYPDARALFSFKGPQELTAFFLKHYTSRLYITNKFNIYVSSDVVRPEYDDLEKWELVSETDNNTKSTTKHFIKYEKPVRHFMIQIIYGTAQRLPKKYATMLYSEVFGNPLETINYTLPENVSVVGAQNPKLIKDDKIQLQVNTPEHKELSKLTVNGVDRLADLQDNKINVVVGETLEVVAEFVDKKYTLTLPTEVTVKQPQNLVLTEILANTEITLTITNPENKIIDKLLLNEEEVVAQNNEYTFTLNGNTQIAVTFKLHTHLLELTGLQLVDNQLDANAIIHNTNVELKVVVPENNVLVNVKSGETILNANSSGNYEVLVDSNKNVVATFELVKHNINITGANASDIAANTLSVSHGANAVLTATIPQGKTVDTFTVDGVAVVLVENQYTIKNIVKTVEVVFILRDLNKFEVTLTPNGNATIELASDQEQINLSEVFENTTLIFNISANEGYNLVNVKVDGQNLLPNDDATYHVTVTAATTISVEVAIKQFNVNITGGNAADIAANPAVVNYNEQTILTATFDENKFEVKTFTVNGSVATLSNKTYTVSNVTSDVNVVFVLKEKVNIQAAIDKINLQSFGFDGTSTQDLEQQITNLIQNSKFSVKVELVSQNYVATITDIASTTNMQTNLKTYKINVINPFITQSQSSVSSSPMGEAKENLYDYDTYGKINLSTKWTDTTNTAGGAKYIVITLDKQRHVNEFILHHGHTVIDTADATTVNTKEYKIYVSSEATVIPSLAQTNKWIEVAHRQNNTDDVTREKLELTMPARHILLEVITPNSENNDVIRIADMQILGQADLSKVTFSFTSDTIQFGQETHTDSYVLEVVTGLGIKDPEATLPNHTIEWQLSASPYTFGSKVTGDIELVAVKTQKDLQSVLDSEVAKLDGAVILEDQAAPQITKQAVEDKIKQLVDSRVTTSVVATATSNDKFSVVFTHVLDASITKTVELQAYTRQTNQNVAVTFDLNGASYNSSTTNPVVNVGYAEKVQQLQFDTNLLTKSGEKFDKLTVAGVEIDLTTYRFTAATTVLVVMKANAQPTLSYKKLETETATDASAAFDGDVLTKVSFTNNYRYALDAIKVTFNGSVQISKIEIIGLKKADGSAVNRIAISKDSYSGTKVKEITGNSLTDIIITDPSSISIQLLYIEFGDDKNENRQAFEVAEIRIYGIQL